MDRSMFASVKRKYAEVERFIKLFAEAAYLLFYPCTIIIVVLHLRLGVLSWLIIAGFLTPPTIAWYIIMSRRFKRYLKVLMDNKPRVWNVKKLVKEYLELLKKNERSKDS